MQTRAEPLAGLGSLNQVVVPDLWQQQAVSALRAGKDVVLHAPTGAGKTLVFELWSNQGRNRGQAIYTVPTRALANDKLAEWRAQGWNVGIATGDLAENLGAPVLVATLETQKDRLVAGEGPTLLVVDEYQMIADPDRGLNYELAIALAPANTQLLLLSGSVSNPQDVVKWLRRLGRDALLVRHDERPVPLEEVFADSLNYHVPSEIRGYWPRTVAKALAEGLGPLLLFAPRRQMAEALAAELARYLPNPDPLPLTVAQKQIVGEHLTRLLKSRIAFHHSGLSYAARAGVIEPLAKAGQLRVVVATMGLAAGINFCLRSVALAGDSYRREAYEQPLRPDEVLQMFGRAGRRGIDEMGYVLVAANEIRLFDAHACHVSRNGMVDWNALLGVMHAAAGRGLDPFVEAVRVQERLFTVKPIRLGVEESLKRPETPCGLKTDAERARHVRKRLREMLNSRGEWERYPPLQERPVREVMSCSEPRDEPGFPLTLSLSPTGGEGARRAGEGESGFTASSRDSRTMETIAEPPHRLHLRPVLGNPAALERIGTGALVVLEELDGQRIYGRAVTVAEPLAEGRILLAKWVRRLTHWKGRHATQTVWEEQIVPLLSKALAAQRTPLVRLVPSRQRIRAFTSLAELMIRVPVDRFGVPLWRPRDRQVVSDDCAHCELVEICRGLPTAAGTAMLWRRLGLVNAQGVPTRRGRLVSFFSQGDGLAIAAALEDKTYPLEELVYDLANLDAGFRFAGDDNRWAGRLAMACRQTYGYQNLPGYLENGAPPKYGAGAELVVATIHQRSTSKHQWVSEWLGPGDIDRVIIEWRSRLRQVAHAPDLEWPRWREFQERARALLDETESPTLTDLPPLDYQQTKRLEHRLVLRRH